MTDLWRDVRYAVRTLVRARGFSIVAVTILGIGLGASVTIFSTLNGVLLRPLPYSDPDRLVAAWEANRTELEVRSGVSAAVLEVLRTQEDVFAGVAAWRAWGYELGGTDEPERLQGARVSANLFDLLGVPALLGRTFTSGEDAAGAAPVVLLGEELWRRRFGADPAAIGRDLELNGQLHTVVGVVPAGHVLPAADLWVPLIFAQYELDQRGNRALSVVARLGPGVDIGAARAAVERAVTHVAIEFPAHAGWDVALEDLQRDLSGGTRGPLLILFTATCVVLLAACGNLASLLLARSAARRREIALRVALGAGRWRIVRQLVTESTLLVVAAAALGLVLGDAGNHALFVLAAAWLPAGTSVSIDPTVIAFAVVLALVAGASLAAIPALEAVRVDLHGIIRTADSAPPRRSFGLRDATAVGQVVLALLLLVAGGLLLRSFLRVQRVDPGFDPRNVVTMTLSLPARYATPGQRADFFATLEQRVAALPMARAAGLASHLPLGGGLLVSDFAIEGRPVIDPGAMTAHLVTVTTGYFDALSMPVQAGRGFSTADRLDGAPVVVIDAELARRYWPAGDALGRRIRLGATLGADTTWRQIVGIVARVRAVSLERTPEPTLYIPHAQNPWPSLTLVISSNAAPEAVTGAAVAIVRDLDPGRPVYAMRSLDETVTRLLAPRRLQTILMSGFAAAALTLAVLGVYGMLAHAVTQRSRELGVRMALGARRREIIRLCIQRGLARVAIGLALGLLAALALSRLLESLLFGLSPWDPIAYAGAVALLLAAGLVASALPALRAARLDPVDALRHD